MTVYFGSSKIKDIYWGSTKIKEIYRGSKLVYSSMSIKPDTVIFESAVAGNYNVEILVNGIYEVYCIGAGAGGGSGYKFKSGAFQHCTLTGGSGAGFIGEIELTRGNYQITVGEGSNNAGDNNSGNYSVNAGGNSSIDNLIISYGASGSTASGGSSSWSYNISTGGDTPTINVPIISSTLNTSGNNGVHYDSTGHASGGASVYNEYGKGGDANFGDYAYNGADGYIKIVFKRME